jgi:hypothetical protein
MTIFDDDRLELVLADLAGHLDVGAPTAQPERRHRPRLLWAAGAAALVAVAIVAIAPAREAVARWLGIGGTEVRIDPSASIPLDALTIDEGLPRIEQADAEALVGPLNWLETSELGIPAEYATLPEGGVLAAWSDGTTLWIHDFDVDAGLLFKKLSGDSTLVRFVEDLGDRALAITGNHVLLTPNRTIAATTVVLWQVDDREFRLESDRDTEALVAIARQFAVPAG